MLEFHTSGKRIKSALIAALKPAMFNYVSANNVTKHLHIHIIPRYARKINLFGLTFEDTSFGRYYETNPNFTVPEEILLKIKDKIKKEL